MVRMIQMIGGNINKIETLNARANITTVCPVKFGMVSGETKFWKNPKKSRITIFQVFNTENVDSGNNYLNWYFEWNIALQNDF